MTDKEIAFELGTRLIRARLRVSAMSDELDSYRDGGFPRPWKASVDRAYEQILLPAALARIEDLQLALDAASPEDLLRTLHTFLKASLSSGPEIQA